jgi:hypothetical protein
MKEDTKEETNMDNQDNQTREQMEALAKEHSAGYTYGEPCVNGCGSDATTPQGAPFYALRVKSGDIYNLSGLNTREKLIGNRTIDAEGMLRGYLMSPRNDVMAYYLNDDVDIELDGHTVVVVMMLPFTSHENGGETFYTNDWYSPIRHPITPLVEVIEETSITMQTPLAEWKHEMSATPIPSGEYDLTEVIA